MNNQYDGKYDDDIDSDFLGTTYEDPRENNESPADLAVLVDDEGREESLSAEDKIPVHQRPWTKILAVLALTSVGFTGAFAFFMGGQPKTTPGVAKTPQTQGTDRTNFITADDASKTEIALGTQRRAFEGTASPASSPAADTVASPTPSPSVVVTKPSPLPSVVVTAPSSSPVATVKPTFSTPGASVAVQRPRPAVAPQKVARVVTAVARPLPSARPPEVARVIPLPAPAQQLRRSVPAIPQPQKIAQSPAPKPQPVAPVTALNPQPIAKVAAPSATTLPPEEQWIKMAEANRFGGRLDNAIASNSIPTETSLGLPSPGTAPISTPSPEASVSTLALQNRTINIGSNSIANVDENLIAAKSASVPAIEAPTPTPGNTEVAPAPSDPGLQKISLKDVPEAADKDSLKPLITEFGVINGSGQPTSYSIPPGTRVAGTLLTPVQAAGSSKSDRLLAIQLDQPILDKDRRVAVAAQNTQIIFRWSLVDGWIQATSESLVIDGKSVAVTGAFVLQGNDGQPLVASTYQPGADEVAAADRTSFLLGAAKGVGDVLTAPDTSIVTNGLGGVTSASTANRNVLGAVLKGGADPVLQGLTQRNQQRSQVIQSRQPIWYLQPGARVNIFTTTPLTFTK